MTTESCNGRFPPLCARYFPEITNYDFETNISTRGLDNRTFRWEDICVYANWLFQEATYSGEFEYVTGSVTGNAASGRYTLTYPTTDFSGFTGWTLSGGYTNYIGPSGSYFHSGNLTGYNSTPFWANPIEGSTSIGLWCNSSNRPTVISNEIMASVSGISGSANHQVYLQAFVNAVTGNSPRLKAYVRAQLLSATVGYYDPIAAAWTATLPTGSFELAQGTYNEIKYKFNASDFGFATPDRYRLVIENPVTGSFVTIDDAHIDQYMKKNPFLDYIIPTGYLIQMTPDLGWHNQKALFDGDGKSLNPFIRTIGPFSVDAGNLTDNLDNSVSVTIDEADFNDITYSVYSKYLWRAIAISPNGDLGNAGMPESFIFVGREIEKDFSIDEVREDPASPIKTIVGKRNNRMTVLVDDLENHPGLEYISPKLWKLEIHVEGQNKIVCLQGKDAGGATTSKRYVELTNQVYQLSTKALWNIFDEHGVLLDIPRLPNESNKDYKLRLIDSNVARGGPTHVGVLNSASREVGLRRIPNCLTLSIPINEHNDNINSSLSIEFGSVYVNIRSPNMRITERLYVDPVYNTINLSKTIHDFPEKIVTDDKLEISPEDFNIEINDDRPSLNRIKINYTPAHGRYVSVTYSYSETLLYKQYSDLYSLTSALNGLTDNAGLKLVDAKLSHKMSGNESTLGLYILSKTITSTNSMEVPWTPVNLRRVSDKHFREYFLNEDNTYSETKFQEYINELKYNSRTLWPFIEADRDFWDAVDSTKDSFDFVPTLFDPNNARFHTSSVDSNFGIVSSNSPNHFIWIAGQSNAHGVGILSQPHNSWRSPNTFVQIWSTRTSSTPRFEPLTAGVNTWGHMYGDLIPVFPWFGSEMQFANRITDFFASKNLLSPNDVLNVKFVKTVFDGSHIDQWTVGGVEDFASQAIGVFQKAVEAAGGATNVQSVTFIWYQGESNLLPGYYVYPYATKLINILNAISNSVGNIPFRLILTKIHPGTRFGIPSLDAVIPDEVVKQGLALEEVAKSFPNCEIIETQDLPLNTDSVHLKGEGQDTLGDRYFEAWIKNLSITRSPSNDQFIDGMRAWGMSYIGSNNEFLINKGLSYKIFRPGVAYKNDLAPDIHVTYNIEQEPDYQKSTVSLQMNDNNNIVFSGQR